MSWAFTVHTARCKEAKKCGTGVEGEAGISFFLRKCLFLISFYCLIFKK